MVRNAARYATRGAANGRYAQLQSPAVHEHLRHQQYLWQLIGTIFRQLSQLEYIGKNKEGWQTFINENPVAKAVPAGVSATKATENDSARGNPFTT